MLFFVFFSVGLSEIIFENSLVALPVLIFIMACYRTHLNLKTNILSFLLIFSKDKKIDIIGLISSILVCLYIFITQDYFLTVKTLITFPFVLILVYTFLFEGVSYVD